MFSLINCSQDIALLTA